MLLMCVAGIHHNPLSWCSGNALYNKQGKIEIKCYFQTPASRQKQLSNMQVSVPRTASGLAT